MATSSKGRLAPPHTPAPGATPARAWRDGQLVALPGSGHQAVLRKPSLRALLSAGRVPNTLRDQVYRLAHPQAVAVVAAQDDAGRAALFHEESAAFIYIASQCFVSPRLVTEREPDYDANEIGPEDISDLDYIWLFYSWTEGSRETALPFLVTTGGGDAGHALSALPSATSDLPGDY